MSLTLSESIRAAIKNYLDMLPRKPTQASIGRAVQRTQTWVSHYLSGRHDIDLNTLSRLCLFLDIKVADLLADSVAPKAERSLASEASTLMQAISPEEQQAILDVLRALARKPAAKRAR